MQAQGWDLYCLGRSTQHAANEIENQKEKRWPQKFLLQFGTLRAAWTEWPEWPLFTAPWIPYRIN